MPGFAPDRAGHERSESLGTPPATSPEPQGTLLHRLLPVSIVAVLLVTALVVFGDARELAATFRDFRWWLTAPILLLTIWNYGWRFVKWQLYLDRLGVLLPSGVSIRVFLAGFAMAVTPGKIGEIVKAVYVRRFTGIAVSRTTAAIAAERATDAVAMLILAGLGAIVFSYGRAFLAVAALVGAIGVLALQRPEALVRRLDRLSHLPLIGTGVEHAGSFLYASGELFRPALFTRAVGLGVVAWTGECAAFFLVLVGLGLEPSARLLLIATFILAVSSLAGGASMLPGGLGVAEAGIAGLLLVLVHDDAMTRSLAAAATILIRFATLWFAVILGALAVITLERRLGRAAMPRQPVQSAPHAEIGPMGQEAPPGDLRAAGDGGDL